MQRRSDVEVAQAIETLERIIVRQLKVGDSKGQMEMMAAIMALRWAGGEDSTFGRMVAGEVAEQAAKRN